MAQVSPVLFSSNMKLDGHGRCMEQVFPFSISSNMKLVENDKDVEQVVPLLFSSNIKLVGSAFHSQHLIVGHCFCDQCDEQRKLLDSRS